MDKYIFDESNGLWYELQGDYYIPCPIRQSGKRRGAAYRTGVAESNPKVFGAEKQARAWETDHAAAYEAERGCFQHRGHRQQY